MCGCACVTTPLLCYRPNYKSFHLNPNFSSVGSKSVQMWGFPDMAVAYIITTLISVLFLSPALTPPTPYPLSRRLRTTFDGPRILSTQGWSPPRQFWSLLRPPPATQGGSIIRYTAQPNRSSSPQGALQASLIVSPSARPFASVPLHARYLKVQAGRRRGKIQRNHRVSVLFPNIRSSRSDTHPHTPVTNLGLHSAAASGDYGLVRYALSNGQPINSVLHGVLPIHVACSGGDEQVVHLLIDHGADVNAPRYVYSFPPAPLLNYLLPCVHLASSITNFHIYTTISRLPLRYTSDKNRDASAPIVGTSGSTPLHFACANGHVNIVVILLQHGAHPDRADKHGVTPESLARENGHENCAETIRQWIEQKDQDLKNRAEYPYDGPSSSTLASAGGRSTTSP